MIARTHVGRDAECAALRARLQAAGTGPVTVILVAGEAGAGKTSLVEYVLEAGGIPALRGCAAEWAYTAYDAIARAIRPCIRDCDGPAPSLLAPILPELGAPPAEEQPAALAGALGSLLTRVADGRPLVLFLDDLQWADEATLSLLPALADAARGLPWVIVGCYRTDELARGHSLRTIRAQLRRTHQLAEIELGPLSDGEVTRMLTGLLGAAPQPTLAEVVASRADGLPFAVEELAFALRDAGRLARVGDTYSLAGAGAAPIPDGIREAVLLRSARLSDPEQSLLEAAAVAGLEFDMDAVLTASGIATWPDGFTGGGLVTEVADGRAAFRHSLTREAIYTDIPWTRRRRLHRELARTLTAADATPALIAAHLLAARDFEPARRALITAADAYWAVHAYRDAARALRTALEHWPPDPDDVGKTAVIDRLARCAEMCSDYADAVALLRELADDYQRAGDQRALAGTHRRLALAHELRGQWESALAERESAAQLFAAAGWPAEAAIDRLAVATHLRAAASYSAALATLSTASADAEASGRTDLVLRMEGLRGNLLCRLGRPGEGLAAVRTALGQALVDSLPDTAAELHQRLADSLEHSGDYHAATAAYAAAYQFCDAHGADAIGQMCRACVTPVLFARGDWDRAVTICEDVLAAAAPPHSQAASICTIGLVHGMRGATKLARRELIEANLIATRIDLIPVRLFTMWGLCVIDQATGAVSDAADRARQILTLIAQSQERHYSLALLPWTATFFAERGLSADALVCAARLSEIAEQTAQPEAVAALAHARGETLLADQPETAARELRHAADMFGQLQLPLATAQAQRRAAAAAARLGAKTEARELLHAAHDTADRLGARHLRDTCVVALAELGDKPGRRHHGATKTAGLSSREMDVMRLVARGNTSKEVGTALFISPRTVEMHVQRSLTKLQCRTRADAVRRLAELEVLPPG